MWRGVLFGVIAVILVGIMDRTKGDPIFSLVGPDPMRLKENEVFFIAASYKYCSDSYPCPSCPRRVFVNVFSRSKCLGTVQANNMNCMYHNCKRTQIRAPPQEGTYDIRMYEILGNGSCGMYRDASGQGRVVGTVIVGTPPQEPANVLVTNVGFFSATIQWTQATKDSFCTVLIEDDKGNTRILADKTRKRRVTATKLAPGTDYNVSLKASNGAGDSAWIVYSFTTKQASLSLVLAPKNKNITVGQSFTLRCLVIGPPRPTITWFKDGRLLGNHHHGRILHVPRASTDDEGEYVCTASNGIIGKNITVTAQVFVVAPPMIPHLYSFLSHETISVKMGQTVLLLCGQNEENHVNYAWFKDGSLLSNASNRTNELTISLNRRDDFGVYECEGFNKAGKMRKRVHVFADEDQTSLLAASTRDGKAAYFYYIVGILACLSVFLLVIVVAQRQYYRRKLSVGENEERPYLTTNSQTTRQNKTEPQHSGKVKEASQIPDTILSLEYPRPLPPIPTERSKVDAEGTRYAGLESIEKLHNYQELEKKGLKTSDACPDLENVFENDVKLETEDKSYVEVVA